MKLFDKLGMDGVIREVGSRHLKGIAAHEDGHMTVNTFSSPLAHMTQKYYFKI
jgi:hypothetical protein